MRLTKAAGIGLVMLSLSACAGSAGADRGSTAPSIRPQAAAAVFHGFRVAMTTALGQRDVGTMRRLETGAALAESLAAVRTAGVQPNVTLSLEHDLGPVTIYPSAGASYPQWFLASSPYSDDPGRTEFDIFTRDSAADPWMESFHTLATAHVLEPPRLRAGALESGTAAERARADRAMTAVADYLATAKAPDLLTDTVLAEGSIGTFQQHQILDADIATGSRTCRLAPAPPVAVIRTAGGAAQAFGVLDCQTSWRAKPGHVVGLNDNLRAWGSDLGAGQSVTYEDEAQVAVSVLKNGETQLIGYSNNLVYATLY